MGGRVITIAQQKGGAGKTTLVAHLAVAIRDTGCRVATVDIDPQASLSHWHEARAAHDGADAIAHRQITGWRTAGEVDKLRRDFDVVVIDSPPHAETEARIAVRAADLVLVPVQPSPMDFWATKPTLEMASREGVPSLLVLNRVPPRARLTDSLVAEIKKLGAPVAENRIGNRVPFAAALMRGQSVTESARRTRAADEVHALADEILTRLSQTKGR